jgi:hypothetical protein
VRSGTNAVTRGTTRHDGGSQDPEVKVPEPIEAYPGVYECLMKTILWATEMNVRTEPVLLVSDAVVKNPIVGLG